MSEMTLAKVGELELSLLLSRANRHGCVTGATGTGKTVTLERLAEMFSRNGVPVFLADVKGDLAGSAAAGAKRPSRHAAAIASSGTIQAEPLRAITSSIGIRTSRSRKVKLNSRISGVERMPPSR